MHNSIAQRKSVEAEIVEPRMISEESRVQETLILPSVPMSPAGMSELQICIRNVVQGAIKDVPELKTGQIAVQIDLALIPAIQLNLKKM